MSFPVIQEPDKVRARRLIGIGFAGVIITLVSLGIADALLASAGRGRDQGTATPTQAPAEMGTIEQTLVLSTRRGIDLRNEQLEELERYGWADRDAGLAKIPIERAMDIVAGGRP
jgi:hypothetical protein